MSLSQVKTILNHLLRQQYTNPSSTNDEINSEKITKHIGVFQVSLGGQHIVKLTTSPFAPQILF